MPIKFNKNNIVTVIREYLYVVLSVYTHTPIVEGEGTGDKNKNNGGSTNTPLESA